MKTSHTQQYGQGTYPIATRVKPNDALTSILMADQTLDDSVTEQADPFWCFCLIHQSRSRGDLLRSWAVIKCVFIEDQGNSRKRKDLGISELSQDVPLLLLSRMNSPHIDSSLQADRIRGLAFSIIYSGGPLWETLGLASLMTPYDSGYRRPVQSSAEHSTSRFETPDGARMMSHSHCTNVYSPRQHVRNA